MNRNDLYHLFPENRTCNTHLYYNEHGTMRYVTYRNGLLGIALIYSHFPFPWDDLENYHSCGLDGLSIINDDDDNYRMELVKTSPLILLVMNAVIGCYLTPEGRLG